MARPRESPLPPPEAAGPEERHPCADLSAKEARYLLAVRELQDAEAKATLAALARAVDVAPPTALEMVRRLRSLGYVEDDAIALTQEGTSAALVLSSRRSAAHALTHDILGLDDEQSRSEAERLASSVSASLGQRLVRQRARQPRR